MALDDFIRGYIDAALWSSTDNSNPSGGQPLSDNFDEGDIDPGTLAQMRSDCEAFLQLVESFAREGPGGNSLAEVASAIEVAGFDPLEADAMMVAGDYLQERGFTEDEIDAFRIRAPLLRLIEDGDLETEQTGHNFWLSRNGHGAGFFDSDTYRGEEQVLQDMAETFGTFDLDVMIGERITVGESADPWGGPIEWWVFVNDIPNGEPHASQEEAYGAALRMAINDGEAVIVGN